ncbi:MAG: hypothetical protein BWX80_01104 [Candidatus Hydrogenedentes bacterium ADurb.Bin101]|nr:MAG: hypothetical protein BWX80_01104 [Candidatus Hydrogenedentes bacterium ADurb.Bin101]
MLIQTLKLERLIQYFTHAGRVFHTILNEPRYPLIVDGNRHYFFSHSFFS